MDNREIAQVFEKIAFFLKIKVADKQRIKSYEKAAQTAQKLEEELEDMLLEGYDISSIDGFGKIFAKKIEQLIIFGNLKVLDELLEEFPETLFDLAKAVALNPEEMHTVYTRYQVATSYELRKLYRENPKLTLPQKVLQKVRDYCEK
jgi:DNA polymerase (family 10)